MAIKAQDEKGQVCRSMVADAGSPKDLPSWLPIYPGTPEGVVSHSSAEASVHTFGLTLTDPVDKVLAFYQEQLENAGLTVPQPMTVAIRGQTNLGIVIADSPDDKRHVHVAVQARGDETKVAVTFVEKP